MEFTSNAAPCVANMRHVWLCLLNCQALSFLLREQQEDTDWLIKIEMTALERKYEGRTESHEQQFFVK